MAFKSGHLRNWSTQTSNIPHNYSMLNFDAQDCGLDIMSHTAMTTHVLHATPSTQVTFDLETC